MFIVVASGLLVGGLLGRHLTVVGLIPAMVVAAGIAAASGFVQGGISDHLIRLIALFVAMQLGYFGSVAARFCVALRQREGNDSAARAGKLLLPP